MITKPMLAGKCSDVAKLRYPVLATPKLDGIRCLVINGKAVSRKFKPIPNDHIRLTIEAAFVVGRYTAEFDGEIMVRGRNFNELSGDVRRIDGTPDFYYAVFDKVLPDLTWGGLAQAYEDRMRTLGTLSLPDFCKKILPEKIGSESALASYEAEQLAKGYEGVMVRSPNSPYKCGRSTENEGYLLKIKRFEDSEAYVLGYDEEMENQNVATKDAFGRTERSSHKENLAPKGTLGKLILKPISAGEINDTDLNWFAENKNRLEAALREQSLYFGCGTGYTAKQRQDFWNRRNEIIRNITKYKHQPSGADEKPRFPVFLGFRDEWDT